MNAVSDTSAARPSLGVRLILRLLRGYKIFISPHFRGSCRFLPSCADYSAEAFARHGFARGAWLTVARLARCHPFCAAGYDPVPHSHAHAKPAVSGPGRTN